MANASLDSVVSAPGTAPASAGTSVRSTDAGGDALAERLAGELAAAWRAGRRLLVEELLGRHPELHAGRELTVRLVYEEFCLRQELDPVAAPAEVLERFPHLGGELAILLDCHRLLETAVPAPRFPQAGETLGDFVLVAELGRGARGHVFLATQPALAGRPVVLKCTPADDHEYLSLARLQHTFIVPLYSREDFPARQLRVLCMPYLGGATLAQVLQALHQQPPGRRTGADLLAVLDQAQSTAPLALPRHEAARACLARLSYVRAVCRIGACLAEALQYAHERGLVHLDLKPSNVLLAADGTPLLLDFHLAREPVPARQPAPAWLGGTPGYMSPEQEAALAAVREGRPVPTAVDGRSDLYALGVLLYEALAGTAPGPARLERCNPQVSVGLADIVHRCLARDPGRRYPDAASLATDLRRHLDDLPLRGVANRSWGERWRKWRRRRPYALPLIALGSGLLAVLLAAGAFAISRYEGRHSAAETAFNEGREQLRSHRYREAVASFKRGQELVAGLPANGDLKGALAGHMRLAERAQAAQALHGYADAIRALFEADPRDRARLFAFERVCRTAWESGRSLAAHPEARLEDEAERDLRADLIELAVCLADLGVRRARDGDVAGARQEALRLLDEAEGLCEPSPVLDHERRFYAEALGLRDRAEKARPARTPEEHCALGRRLLSAGDTRRAAAEIDQALRLQPEGFWPNYYHGVLAYRGRRYQEAVEAFCVCVGSGRLLGAEEGLRRRAQAYAALGRTDAALGDLDWALQINPDFAAAAYDRGLLHLGRRHYAEAAADLRRALKGGADPAAVRYRLAWVALEQHDWAAALEQLGLALRVRSQESGVRSQGSGVRNQPAGEPPNSADS